MVSYGLSSHSFHFGLCRYPVASRYSYGGLSSGLPVSKLCRRNEKSRLQLHSGGYSIQYSLLTLDKAERMCKRLQLIANHSNSLDYIDFRACLNSIMRFFTSSGIGAAFLRSESNLSKTGSL